MAAGLRKTSLALGGAVDDSLSLVPHRGHRDSRGMVREEVTDRLRGAVGGAVAPSFGFLRPLAEEEAGVLGDAAHRIADDDDDGVVLDLDGARVVAWARRDEAPTRRVVEGAVGAAAALARAEAGDEQVFLDAAEGDLVALVGGDGAAALVARAPLLGVLERGPDFRLVEDVVAVGRRARLD